MSIVGEMATDALIALFCKTFLEKDDQGIPRLKDLMRWYVLGEGKSFTKTNKNKEWADYMRSRPEIRDEADKLLKKNAEELCADKKEKTGSFEKNAKQIQLKSSEAMRFSLHGCHRLVVKASYSVTKEGGDFVVKFNSNWKWIDAGDLHDNLATKLKSGVVVDDKVLKELGKLLNGKEYPIEISWDMPEKTYRIPRDRTVCEAPCKNYKKYENCDNPTYDGERCRWHR